MFKVAYKINRCRLELLNWNRQQQSNLAVRIQKLRKEIKVLRENEGHRDWEWWTTLRSQLDIAYKDEEVYWSQKERVQWLKEGDKNSHFLHASVVSRRKSNRIEQLDKEKRGYWRTDEEMVSEIFEFYSDLFTIENSMGWESKLNGILSTITGFMNSRIIGLVDNNEIKKVVFSINPNKAPGMNGMTPLFFQTF